MAAGRRGGTGAAHRRGRPWSLALSMFATTLGTVLAGLIASFLLVLYQAPARVQAECESAMDLARRLIHAAERAPAGAQGADRLLSTVLALREIRHLEVEMQGIEPQVRPAQGGAARHGLAAREARIEGDVPVWFLAWMGNAVADIVPLRVGHHPVVGAIIVHPQPYDEAREFWDELQVVVGYHLTLFLLVSVLLFVVIRRGLWPLRELQAAFDRLGRGDFSHPVREDVPGELQAIHAAFNHTAGLLQHLLGERETLSRQLVRLQEEERTAIARELHDELAPFLFCVRLDASTNLTIGDDTPMEEIRDAFASIDANVAQIQGRIRDLLQRLRPVDIDVHGWPEALVTLLDGFRSRFPQIAFHLEADGLEAVIDDTARVSVYRMVQECLTNVVRHAQAHAVWVRVHCAPDQQAPAVLEIQVQDDGRGPPAEAVWGRGLTGMRERLQALGGSLQVAPASPHGTRVTGRLPLPA